MRLVDQLAQNPEAIAIAVIRLLLGTGNAAPSFVMRHAPEVGIRRMMERPYALPCLPKINVRIAGMPELPEMSELPEVPDFPSF